MIHSFTNQEVDILSGKTYQVCKKCKQILIEGDIFFNTFCPADNTEIDGIKNRVSAKLNQLKEAK